MQGLVLAEAQPHPNIFIYVQNFGSRLDFAEFTKGDDLGNFYLIFSAVNLI